MTRWRAVGIGVVVELFLGLVGLIIPGVGQLFAGLVGGFIAGYLCRSSVKSGIWHGLLAGGIGGFLLAVPLGLLAGWIVTGIGLTDPTGGLFTSIGVAGLVLIVAVVLAADSAVGGGMGALVYRFLNRRETVEPDRSARLIETVLGPDGTGHEDRNEIRIESSARSSNDDGR